MFNLNHEFFRPLWARLGTVAFCVGWSLFENLSGNPVWGSIFFALAAWTTCHFLFWFKVPEKRAETEEE